jgi:hypothetical protein
LNINQTQLASIFEHNPGATHIFYSWLTQALAWANPDPDFSHITQEEKILRFTQILNPLRTLENIKTCVDMGADPELGLKSAIVIAHVDAVQYLLEKGARPQRAEHDRFDAAYAAPLTALEKQTLEDLFHYRKFEPIQTHLSQLTIEQIHAQFKAILTLLCAYAEKYNLRVNSRGELTPHNGQPLNAYFIGAVERDNASTQLVIDEYLQGPEHASHREALTLKIAHQSKTLAWLKNETSVGAPTQLVCFFPSAAEAAEEEVATSTFRP